MLLVTEIQNMAVLKANIRGLFAVSLINPNMFDFFLTEWGSEVQINTKIEKKKIIKRD